VQDLGPGYIPMSVHNIQAEVPPENILAMFEAIHAARPA
jgi:uroporphyrinogen-III decarboxylase